MELGELGWSDFFAQAACAYPDPSLHPARVALVFRGGYELWTESGEFIGQVSGRFRHQARVKADFPATGDWALVELLPGEQKAQIHALLPRRSKLSRTAAGRVTEEQVLAANVDDLFIAASLADHLNLRRLERYITLACDNGVNPIVLLTKSDLCEDVSNALDSVRAIAPEAPIIPVSSLTGRGLDEARRHFACGRTAAVLGPSGVGKSTLINALCGEELLPTLPVREKDQKGRHTTTERELIPLPGGGLIIDTPGLRELQLWEGDEGLAGAFPEIEELAAGCRFADCRHDQEPGCAVRQAIAAGEVEPERFQSYLKLQREAHHFEARRDARVQAEERRKSKALSKNLRARLREKGRDEH